MRILHRFRLCGDGIRGRRHLVWLIRSHIQLVVCLVQALGGVPRVQLRRVRACAHQPGLHPRQLIPGLPLGSHCFPSHLLGAGLSGIHGQPAGLRVGQPQRFGHFPRHSEPSVLSRQLRADDACLGCFLIRARAHLLVGHVYRHGLQHCRHALHLGGFGRLLGARRLLGSTRWGARGQRREGARQQGGDNDDGFETQRRHCPSVEQLQKTCRGAAWIQSRGVPAKWTKREAEKGIP
mmetsp:Transcript_50539/g.94151  ORF Transcript_50539/g.94151 Transcript_50539/m.94151 type:complete len:236 (-) Transcript_50539:77-784(-)